MTNGPTGDFDWLDETASHTLGELYVPLLEESKSKEGAYELVPAMIAIAGAALYWVWVFSEGKGLQEAFTSVHDKAQAFIDAELDEHILEAANTEKCRRPPRTLH